MTIIPADDSIEIWEDPSAPTLATLQSHVGGYIEIIPGSRPFAFCNEDGLPLRLPFNRRASKRFSQSLVGTVVHLTQEEQKQWADSSDS